MIDQKTRSAAVRIAALNSHLLAVTEWAEREVADIAADVGTPDQWQERMEELNPIQRQQLDFLLSKIPTAKEVNELDGLLVSLGNPQFRRLGVEDRQYLAEARCALLDAHQMSRNGDFHEAYEQAQRGYDRLRWMLHERRRDGTKWARQLPGELRTLLEDLVASISACLQALAAAAHAVR